MLFRSRTPSGCYVELPAKAFVRWKALPLPGRSAHSAIFSHVSVAVQLAFRRYFAESFFDSVKRYEQRDLAWAVMAFSCSRPYRMRSCGEFTHDVMSFDVARKALRFTRNAFTARLSETEDMLYAAGRRDLAHYYAPYRVRGIMDDILKADRHLVGFLRVESKLVDALVKFAYEMRNLRESQRGQKSKRSRNRAAHEAISIANEAGRKVNGLLRRLTPRRDYYELGSIILLEATYALNGRKTPLPERSPLADRESLSVLADLQPSKAPLRSAFDQCEAELISFFEEEVGLPEEEPEETPPLPAWELETPAALLTPPPDRKSVV